MKKILLLIAFYGVSHSIPVYADGPLAPPASGGGQYGANRRVRTYASGFTAVKGNFTLPSRVFVPSWAGFEITDPNIPHLPYGSIENPSRSKPSFYLGCSQRKTEPIEGDENDVVDGVEVDAGLQYEFETIPYLDEVDDTFKSAGPGWGVFVNTKNSQGFNTQNPKSGWRCGPKTLNKFVTSLDLEWSIYKLSVFDAGGYGGYLYVNAIGADKQPIDDYGNEGYIYAASGENNSSFQTKAICQTYNEMRVKRVVAITQGGAFLRFPLPFGGVYEEDGSFMHGCNFSQGGVSAQNPASFSSTPISWLTWDSVFTDNQGRSQDDTGYYPGGRDKTIRSDDFPNSADYGPFVAVLGNATGSRPIFSFGNLPQSQWDQVVSSRYAIENIDINLRSATPFHGKFITPSSITPGISE